MWLHQLVFLKFELECMKLHQCGFNQVYTQRMRHALHAPMLCNTGMCLFGVIVRTFADPSKFRMSFMACAYSLHSPHKQIRMYCRPKHIGRKYVLDPQQSTLPAAINGPLKRTDTVYVYVCIYTYITLPGQPGETCGVINHMSNTQTPELER